MGDTELPLVKDASSVTRAEVEDFLYAEAAILDAWRLDDWLVLLTDDARYWVPPNDSPDRDPSDTLFTIADDIRRIRERVKRLKDRNAHAEYPRSRTRRIISNVRVVARRESEIDVASSFVVFRFRKDENVREFVGGYKHTLRIADGRMRIAHRVAVIDAMELGSLGAVSFIL
jgi:p-cumate 2,3-dioxygenase beta subunit